MSKVCLIIFLLSFLPIILTLPSPRIVYSAIIYNRQNSSIQCQITWRIPSQYALQSKILTISAYHQHSVGEQLIDMKTWTARAVIDQIQCDNNRVLNAPFDNVEQPSVNCIFVVTPDRIVSLGSLDE